MDENNMNYASEKIKKENPFTKWTFYTAFFIVVGIIFFANWYITEGFTAYQWILDADLVSIASAVLGLIIWGIVRIKNKPVALGILLGSLMPFTVIFIATGGCSPIIY